MSSLKPIANIYLSLIRKEKLTINDVPEHLKDDVLALLNESEEQQ